MPVHHSRYCSVSSPAYNTPLTVSCLNVQHLQQDICRVSLSMHKLTNMYCAHAPMQDDQDQAQLSILMGGKPSGRSQTLMLTSWLRDQIAACSTTAAMLDLHDTPRTTVPVNDQVLTHTPGAAADSSPMTHSQTLRHSKGRSEDLGVSSALPTQPSEGLSGRQTLPSKAVWNQTSSLTSGATPRCPDQGKLGRASPVASPRRLGLAAQSLGLAPQLWGLPQSPSQASIPAWQGLLPEAAESLGLPMWAHDLIHYHADKAGPVLSLLGTAFGVLVHQVAMHCFERGTLMAGLWNMFTALMDAEVQSLEEHVQVQNY